MRLDIVTPRGTLLSSPVDELVAPGALGELGVLSGHIPLVSALRPGVVRYRHGATSGVLAVSVGFLEVAPGDRVVLLAQEGALADNIDVGKARGELDEALRALAEVADAGEREKLELRVAWAQARLDAAHEAGKAPAPGH